MTEVTIDDTVVTDFPKLEESIFYSVGEIKAYKEFVNYTTSKNYTFSGAYIEWALRFNINADILITGFVLKELPTTDNLSHVVFYREELGSLPNIKDKCPEGKEFDPNCPGWKGVAYYR